MGKCVENMENKKQPLRSKEDERRAQWLEIGVGAQILRDLGLSRIRLIAGREVDYVGVEGFGLVLESTELLND